MPTDAQILSCPQTKKKVNIIHFSAVIYHFWSLVFNDTENVYGLQTILRFLMWLFKNINW